MASWRDNLRRCSWRGIECLYDSARVTRGRRLVVTEYPQRDEPDIQDMGRKAREYPMELYLLASQLGDAFWPTRDRLVAALDAGGTGTLVHPYYGELELHAGDVDESYQSREGGLIRFSVTFKQGKEPARPTTNIVTQDEVVEAGDALEANAEAVFLAQWSTVGFSEFVRESASRALQAASDATGLPLDRGIQIGRNVLERVENVPVVAEWLRGMRARLGSYGLPRIRALRTFGDGGAIGNSEPFAGFQPPTDRVLTPSEQQQLDNSRAAIDYVRVASVAAAGDVISRTTFESVDEAIATRDEIVDQIDELQLTAPDVVFESLQHLRAAIVADIRARGAGLPNVRQYTPSTTEPALVIAHRLYGDATREADIVTRNRIEHPGFVAGGQAIEVLTDG